MANATRADVQAGGSYLPKPVALPVAMADGLDGRCHTAVGEGDDGESLGRELARQLLDTVAW